MKKIQKPNAFLRKKLESYSLNEIQRLFQFERGFSKTVYKLSYPGKYQHTALQEKVPVLKGRHQTLQRSLTGTFSPNSIDEF